MNTKIVASIGKTSLVGANIEVGYDDEGIVVSAAGSEVT